MKIKKPKAKARQARPDFSKMSLLDAVVWFVVTLAGTLVSIVLLILFRRRQTGAPSARGTADTEEEADARPEPAPDDDPRIFNLRIFGYFTVFLVGLIVFVLAAGMLLSGFFLPGRSVIITPAPTLLPPAPRLESYPGEQFPALHATQQAELDSYGWVDRQKGVLHIPIDRAMELIAQSNLPVATGTPVAATPYSP
jgi:hypothetical protein